MPTIEVEEILTVDDSSGVLHRRWRIPGSDELTSFEADNLDAAGAYTEVDNASDPRVQHLCERCFPVGVTS